MSTLSEGELHVQAMRLVCEALAEREKTGLEVDWDVINQQLDHMDVILQGIVDQRADDAGEIETLRQQLADAQRAVSDAFAEVNSVRQQLDAAGEAETFQRTRIERLHKFVGQVRKAIWPEDLRSALKTLDAEGGA